MKARGVSVIMSDSVKVACAAAGRGTCRPKRLRDQSRWAVQLLTEVVDSHWPSGRARPAGVPRTSTGSWAMPEAARIGVVLGQCGGKRGQGAPGRRGESLATGQAGTIATVGGSVIGGCESPHYPPYPQSASTRRSL